MKQIALCCAILCSMSTVIAQDNIIIQVVDRSSKNPLPGATIIYNNKAFTTDARGSCTPVCAPGSAISVSYVGYTGFFETVKSCSPLVIELLPDVTFLQYVEVTATSAKNKELLYQANSISKLTLTELKRGQGIFFDDAIHTNVPGVQMNRRSVAGGQQFNIRGYGNGARGTRGVSSNFDGQGYKVYLNGIPVTDAEGITTMDDIDFGSIGNAEFVKGPAGTLYGQAIAGAINLWTVLPENGKTTLGQELQVGNYGLRRTTTTLRSANEKAALLLNYGHQRSDGFAWHNSSQKDFVNFLYTARPSDWQSVSTYIGFSDSYDERLGELTPSQWAAGDYSGNIEYLRRNAHSHVTTFRAGVMHQYAMTTQLSNTTSVFGTGFRSDVSSAGGWTDKSSINYGLRSSFDFRKSLAPTITLSGITGIELQRQDAQVVGYSMKQSPLDTSTTGWNFSRPYWVINAAISNTAYVTSPTLLFTQWSLNFAKDLSLTAGISYNRQRILLNDRFNSATPTRPALFDTVYKGMLSPYLSVNKVFDKRFSLYASFSTGYKAPVSSYFFITTPTIVNPPMPATARVNGSLRPEKGTQIELGSKGTLLGNALQYQLAFFRTTFTNKMTSVAVPLNNTATAYSYVINGGEQLHQGVEFSIKCTTLEQGKRSSISFTPFMNFAIADFTYGDNFKFVTGSTVATLDTFNYSGLSVFGTPRISGAAGVDLDAAFGGYATVSAIYKGGFSYAMEKISNNPKAFAVRTTEAYALVNLKIGYRKQLTKKWKTDASIGINNLTGVNYPLMVFVNQLPDAFTPAPPRAVWFAALTINYFFNR